MEQPIAGIASIGMRPNQLPPVPDVPGIASKNLDAARDANIDGHDCLERCGQSHGFYLHGSS